MVQTVTVHLICQATVILSSVTKKAKQENNLHSLPREGTTTST